MYAAKAAGGNAVRIFNRTDGDVQARERLRMETELRMALASDQITVFFQPKIDCASGKVTGAEVLARWNHPKRGLLTPGAFIEIAEETGLILRLGDRVLELACRQGREWIDMGHPLPLAVNVSMRQLEWAGYTDRVLEILSETGFPPEMLELELTETVAMADPEHVRQATQRLRRAGIRFAMDDFGTGYSSLAHLQNLPFDTFKIDRSFIAGVGEEGSHRRIVETILAMARSLDYEVVAEGVETEEQLAFLRASGCKTAQGYLFGMPMAATMFAAWRRPYLVAAEGQPSSVRPVQARSAAV
jgi:EAL domain-containing protein (putative c-di-GMP-specific phosphodiesterase class I)